MHHRIISASPPGFVVLAGLGECRVMVRSQVSQPWSAVDTPLATSSELSVLVRSVAVMPSCLHETLIKIFRVRPGLVATLLDRAVGVADLLVAAAAKEAGLTVLHYAGDFDLVASVTGQSCEWIVPAGTAH